MTFFPNTLHHNHSLPSSSTAGEKGLKFSDVKKGFPLPGTLEYKQLHSSPCLPTYLLDKSAID